MRMWWNGRHASLRNWCRKAWGFESLHPHKVTIEDTINRIQPKFMVMSKALRKYDILWGVGRISNNPRNYPLEDALKVLAEDEIHSLLFFIYWEIKIRNRAPDGIDTVPLSDNRSMAQWLAQESYTLEVQGSSPCAPTNL